MPNFIKTIVSVIVHTCWMLRSKRARTAAWRPFQTVGIRIVKHTAYGHERNPNGPVVYHINFGGGAGYRGGATLYLAFGGCRVYDKRPGHYSWRPIQQFVFGLTSNANNTPMAGCWS